MHVCSYPSDDVAAAGNYMGVHDPHVLAISDALGNLRAERVRAAMKWNWAMCVCPVCSRKVLLTTHGDTTGDVCHLTNVGCRCYFPSPDSPVRVCACVRACVPFLACRYTKCAWGKDELLPRSCKGQDNWGGFAFTLVDSLDTLWYVRQSVRPFVRSLARRIRRCR